jgi:hypothetical protein
VWQRGVSAGWANDSFTENSFKRQRWTTDNHQMKEPCVNRPTLSWTVIARACLASLCSFASLLLLSLQPTWVESTTDIQFGDRDGSLQMLISLVLAAAAVGLFYSLARSGRKVTGEDHSSRRANAS